jgi:hypothetical protein
VMRGGGSAEVLGLPRGAMVIVPLQLRVFAASAYEYMNEVKACMGVQPE